MPYKDPDKAREATRQRVKRHRVRQGATIDRLADQVKDAAELPEAPTREFLIRALGVQAREGNVPAIRLLLEEYRRDADPDAIKTDPLARFDELAARRSA
jgi:hypothetical protein